MKKRVRAQNDVGTPKECVGIWIFDIGARLDNTHTQQLLSGKRQDDAVQKLLMHDILTRAVCVLD